MAEVGADPPVDVVDRDQCVVLHGTTWQDYERLLRIRGERSVPRITYLQGELELMSPSERHESIAWTIGWLLGIWAMEARIQWRPLRSTTWRRRAADRGAEADQCFVLGLAPKRRPDLAVEVVVSSPGVRKLEVYRGLGVPEVWFWRDGRLAVHVLRGERYEIAPRSELLPAIDVTLLARLAEQPDPARAARLLQRILQRRAQRPPTAP